MEIFKPQELKKPNIFQKLFGKTPTENGWIEINNLFVSRQSNIEDITIEDIAEIAEKHKINLKKNFKPNRLELFKQYLIYCLKDSRLENTEIRILRHIRDLLFLNENEAKSIMENETEKIYNESVKEAVSDGQLEEFEKQNLERLKKDLLISDEIATEMLETNSKQILQNFIDGAISDERLSPAEEIEINEFAKSLNIDLEIDDKSKAVLDRYKLYWQIENGKLPTIVPDIKIQKSENLYFKTSAKWFEQRRVTKRINYGGPTARIRLAKGVYYRMGSVGVQRVSEDVWQTIDSGQVYLTDKRLIFMGGKGNKTIRLNKILDVTPYKNGIDIQKETGRSPFLEFSNNIDIFSMILVRLMDEY